MKIFCENLGKVLHRPNLLPVPGALVKLLLGDGAKVILEGQNVKSNRIHTNGFRFQYPDLNNALLEITNN